MQTQLDSYRQRIDSALDDFFDSELALAGLELKGYELKAFEYLREFSLRPGKRLRGALTLFAYEQLAGKSSDRIINAAVLQELLQSYLLIIDDVMDRSPQRRGKPTVHRLIAADLGADHQHLADMMAINVGLLASHIASHLLGKIDESSERLSLAATMLHKNILATVYGQIDDLNNDFKARASEEDIVHLLEFKVSYYSFISPLQLGAILAGNLDPAAMSQIEAIGKPAGVAFQLQDDILGLFGKTSETGKSASDDVKEGKFTLLMLYTLERAAETDAAKIRAALGNQNLSESEIEEIRSLVEACGARAAVEDKARAYARQSKDALIKSTIFSSTAKDFLSDLIDYVTDRKN